MKKQTDENSFSDKVEVVSFLEKIQYDNMNRSSGIFVRDFTLTNQSEGFHLCCVVHVPDARDQTKEVDVYGTLIDCVRVTQRLIQEEKQRLIKEINED
jgi:hypothetical protein